VVVWDRNAEKEFDCFNLLSSVVGDVGRTRISSGGVAKVGSVVPLTSDWGELLVDGGDN